MSVALINPSMVAPSARSRRAGLDPVALLSATYSLRSEQTLDLLADSRLVIALDGLDSLPLHRQHQLVKTLLQLSSSYDIPLIIARRQPTDISQLVSGSPPSSRMLNLEIAEIDRSAIVEVLGADVDLTSGASVVRRPLGLAVAAAQSGLGDPDDNSDASTSTIHNTDAFLSRFVRVSVASVTTTDSDQAGVMQAAGWIAKRMADNDLPVAVLEEHITVKWLSDPPNRRSAARRIWVWRLLSIVSALVFGWFLGVQFTGLVLDRLVDTRIRPSAAARGSAGWFVLAVLFLAGYLSQRGIGERLQAVQQGATTRSPSRILIGALLALPMAVAALGRTPYSVDGPHVLVTAGFVLIIAWIELSDTVIFWSQKPVMAVPGALHLQLRFWAVLVTGAIVCGYAGFSFGIFDLDHGIVSPARIGLVYAAGAALEGVVISLALAMYLRYEHSLVRRVVFAQAHRSNETVVPLGLAVNALIGAGLADANERVVLAFRHSEFARVLAMTNSVTQASNDVPASREPITDYDVRPDHKVRRTLVAMLLVTVFASLWVLSGSEKRHNVSERQQAIAFGFIAMNTGRSGPLVALMSRPGGQGPEIKEIGGEALNTLGQFEDVVHLLSPVLPATGNPGVAVQLGFALHHLKRFDDAERLLTPVLAATGDARVATRLGETLNQLGRFDDVVRRLSPVVAATGDGRVASQLGFALNQPGRFNEVVVLLSPVLRATGDAGVAVQLGFAFNRLERFDETVRLLRPVLAATRDARVASQVGEALNRLGKFEDAVRLLRPVRQATGDANVANQLGFALNRVERFDETVRLLSPVLVATGDADVARHLGEALNRLGRSDDAARLLSPVLGATGDADVASNLGFALNRLERFDETVRLLRPVLVATGDADVARHLGEALNRLGRFDDAVRLLSPVLGATGDANVANQLGFALNRLEQSDDAVRLLSPVLAATGDASVAGHLGAALNRLGKFDDTVRLLGPVLAATGNANVANQLGFALNRLEQSDDAVRLLSPVLAATGDANVANQLGFALNSLGRFDDAARLLSPVLAATGDAEVADELGFALDRLDRFDDVVRLLSPVLAATGDVGVARQLGFALNGLGRSDEVIRLLSPVLTKSGDSEVADQLGFALNRLGRFDDVVLMLSPVLAATGNASVAGEVGEALNKLGRFDDVVRLLSPVLVATGDAYVAHQLEIASTELGH